MFVMILPSWYPHRCFPLEGMYIRDQALAIGELRPAWRIGLSLWRQGRNLISWAHATHSPRCLAEALLDRTTDEQTLAPNVTAWTTPALQFPERMRDGNREGLLAAARRNLDRAVGRWGRVDLLHAHVSYPAGWIAMRLAAERGIPYVITEHMGPFPLPVYRRADGALQPWIREPLEHAEARIAVSPALASAIASHGIPAPRVIPNLVDERLFRPDGLPDPATFTFLTICQMVASKGVIDLLRAAALLLGRLDGGTRARVRFRLAGEGPDLGAFRDEARRLGIDPHLVWRERYLAPEETRGEFERCDCYVLASHHESFGIVFAEAMASGKPSIGTRCGGPEAIVTERTGRLVEVGDVPALADAMEHMVRNAAGYDRAAIRAEFDRRFSRAAIVDQIETVYRDALARPPRTRPTW